MLLFDFLKFCHIYGGILMSFDPSYRELRSLLNEDIIFKVPRYQRSYVWTKDEWENLNEDIILAMEKNKAMLKHSVDIILFFKGTHKKFP